MRKTRTSHCGTVRHRCLCTHVIGCVIFCGYDIPWLTVCSLSLIIRVFQVVDLFCAFTAGYCCSQEKFLLWSKLPDIFSWPFDLNVHLASYNRIVMSHYVKWTFYFKSLNLKVDIVKIFHTIWHYQTKLCNFLLKVFCLYICEKFKAIFLNFYNTVRNKSFYFHFNYLMSLIL